MHPKHFVQDLTDSELSMESSIYYSSSFSPSQDMKMHSHILSYLCIPSLYMKPFPSPVHSGEPDGSILSQPLDIQNNHDVGMLSQRRKTAKGVLKE